MLLRETFVASSGNSDFESTSTLPQMQAVWQLNRKKSEVGDLIQLLFQIGFRIWSIRFLFATPGLSGEIKSQS
jgi:hypothetical protein